MSGAIGRFNLISANFKSDSKFNYRTFLNFYVGQVINVVICLLIFRKQRGKSVEFITDYLVLFRRSGVLPTIQFSCRSASNPLCEGQHMSESMSPGLSPLPFDSDIAFPHPRSDALTARAGLLLKRGFDIVGALMLLLILLPLLPFLALAVRMDGGPVLYRHTRVGLNGRTFGCLKYRTMKVGADQMLALHLATNPLAAAEWAATRKLTHDPRVTRLGALMRSASLDELPQLLNVLRGEMSLVGPRSVVLVVV